MTTTTTILVGGFSAPLMAEPFGYLGYSMKRHGDSIKHCLEMKGKGIYIIDIEENGALEYHPQSPIPAAPHPSYIAIHPSLPLVIVAHDTFTEEKNGAISSWKLNKEETNQTILIQTSDPIDSKGGEACMIDFDRSGSFIAVVNYSGQNVCIWKINKEKLSIGEFICEYKMNGNGPNVRRQEAAHPHSIVFHKSNKLAFIADLGSDQIHTVNFDSETGLITAHSQIKITPAGSGPRTLCLHPTLDVLYVTTEMESELHVFQINSSAKIGEPSLSLIDSSPLLPEGWPFNNEKDKEKWGDFNNGKWGSHVSIHPSGKFIYAANRLHDSIVIFKLNQDDGKLVHPPIKHVSCGGNTPRHMTLSPDGKLLLVANQHSCEVSSFLVSEETGDLTFVSNIPIPFPSCVAF
eukprot:c17172_g1_i1.p1 GENE.c17172_g1_i1~~c17172_g1_i1.p1  ORF type:complete len:419 (+),score=227.59 c17172_g1_i1:45-1259(+)